MESMATLGIPAYGYGIRYDYGLFRQVIRDGWQQEYPEEWLSFGNPWEFERPDAIYDISFGGRVERLAGLKGIVRSIWHPDETIEAPVRFLPHWDANLLVHARRTGLLPEAHRPRVFSTKNPFSVGVYLVDGRAAGAWSLVDGRIALDPFEDLSKGDERAVERERAALEAFHS